MNMTGRIVLAVLGLTASQALADHHGMVMGGEPHGSVIGTSVSLLAASFATPDFAGDYEGVIPSVSWSTPRFAVGANVPLYRLQENGRELYGPGDVVVHGQGTFIEAGELHAGALVAVSAPTGDGQAGTGMGHAMAMPALWTAWSHERLTLAGSAGYSRALVDSMTHHDHGPWPLVEPMNMSEISWSASGDIALAHGTHAGARVSGGVPVGAAGTDRVVGAVRVAWGSGAVDTAAELQAGLAGDPFTIRGVVETALHF
jgi:hypothetical protein